MHGTVHGDKWWSTCLLALMPTENRWILHRVPLSSSAKGIPLQAGKGARSAKRENSAAPGSPGPYQERGKQGGLSFNAIWEAAQTSGAQVTTAHNKEGRSVSPALKRVAEEQYASLGASLLFNLCIVSMFDPSMTFVFVTHVVGDHNNHMN
ncbi:hypothetical protein KSP39_PZI006348 [Platanthera zijinensis]|uniref:Uncharacterized protein n=1 Tax=Platanthera zijinensis TaxID=2320716 RepID=A0AAP0BRL3_9ASPA